MATFTEDWGSTLGTLGQLGWARNNGTHWATGSWTAGPDYIAPTSITTTYNLSLLAAVDFRATYGSLAGSFYHSGSATGISLGDVAKIITQIADNDGTGLWLSAGMASGGRYVEFYVTKPADGSRYRVAYNVDSTGSGGNRSFEVWGTHVGGGTWIGTITDSEPVTTTFTYAAGAAFVPESLAYPAIGLLLTSANCRIYSSSWLYEIPPAQHSILRFIGTWATGSGTYEWGGMSSAIPAMCRTAHTAPRTPPDGPLPLGSRSMILPASGAVSRAQRSSPLMAHGICGNTGPG